MIQDLMDDMSTLVWVMAWCRQAASHYLSKCWPTSLLPYGVTRPQWVKIVYRMGYVTWWSLVDLLSRYPLITVDKMATILADDNFKCIFLNENDRIPIWISMKFVPRSPIDNKTALVQVMACRRTGDKPLPELMLAQFTDAYMRI